MPTHDPERLEALLADAIAAHDEQGPAGLDAFLRAHAAERTALERGLARCRQLGLLAANPPTRGFAERLGEFPAAADLHAAIVELAGMTGDPAAQGTAARLWLRLGRLRAGAAAGETALPAPAACHDEAMSCLLNAERLGWGPRNPLGDALYDPLRQRPEFEQLSTRVAARAGPPAQRAR